MATASTYQCPNCEGVLSFNAETGFLECASCGSVFEEGQVEQALPIDVNTEQQKTQHVKTVKQFLENAPWEIEHEGSAASMTTVRYSCPSCGAEVIADQSTVSTSCPYCGNNMFVAGIASEENIPHRIIPFAITREEAEEHMREHFRHKWYLSREFDAQLEHMQAVYVPYYLYDVEIDGWADYIAYHEVDSDNSKSKRYYAVKRAGHASFVNIPVDGSSKMPDAHMDAIAPYDFKEMRDFSTSYVAGYLMEVADEDAQACQEHAEALARKSFEGDMKEDVVDERGINGVSEVVAHKTNLRTTSALSCVLPVWLMHCTWNDVQMLFAVNGETGKCIGDLPISSKRRGLTVFAVAAVLAVLAFLLLGALSEGWREMDNIGLVVGFAIAFVALVTLAVDAGFKAQMRTAVEATNAGMSYDSQGLVVTYRWRTEDSYKSESEAKKQLKSKNAGLIE